MERAVSHAPEAGEMYSGPTGAGRVSRGLLLGVETAQRAEQITGLPTAFLADSTGNDGGVSWLTAFANVAELERAEQKLNTEKGFIELIDAKAAGSTPTNPQPAPHWSTRIV